MIDNKFICTNWKTILVDDEQYALAQVLKYFEIDQGAISDAKLAKKQLLNNVCESNKYDELLIAIESLIFLFTGKKDWCVFHDHEKDKKYIKYDGVKNED